MKQITKKIFITLFALLLVFPMPIFAETENFRVFLTVFDDAPVPPTPPPPPGGGGGGTQFPLVFDVSVAPYHDRAFVTWKTTIPAVSSLSFGLTNGLEIGTVSGGNDFVTEHFAWVENLSPETLYYFEISALSIANAPARSGIMNFRTLSAPGVPNVLSFTARARESDILLEWILSAEARGNTVRIVRSEDSYPASPNEGHLVFEGVGVSVIDEEVEAGVRYFYSLFVRDESGAFSSGAVANARIPLLGEPADVPVDPFDLLSRAPYVDPRIESLTLADFIVVQPGRPEHALSDRVFIEGSINTTIYLPYDRVPEILKTITVTLMDPDDSTNIFSFLLRANEDNSRYSATIGPLGKSGEYKVSIAIVDYQNQGLKQVTGSLLAVVSRGLPEGIFSGRGSVFVIVFPWLLAVLFALSASYFLVHRIRYSGRRDAALPFITS